MLVSEWWIISLITIDWYMHLLVDQGFSNSVALVVVCCFWYSSNTILVDEATVQNEDDVVINCGSEIIPGPAREGQKFFTLF